MKGLFVIVLTSGNLDLVEAFWLFFSIDPEQEYK